MGKLKAGDVVTISPKMGEKFHERYGYIFVVDQQRSPLRGYICLRSISNNRHALIHEAYIKRANHG